MRNRTCEGDTEAAHTGRLDIQERRTAATRVVGGLVSASVGWLLLLLTTASANGQSSLGSAALWNQLALPAALDPLLLVLGLVTLIVGMWFTWIAHRT